MTSLTQATPNPIVFVKDGNVFANSRDVAAFFEKRHDHILRDIDTLIMKSPELSLPNFGEGSYTLPTTGNQKHRCFDMDRDGFTILVMGFTGAKALKWKMRYIQAFNTMEVELKKQTKGTEEKIHEALSNPASLRALLGDYTEKVIELQGQVEEMRPQVQALDRIANSDGSLCITDAAKTLQVRPKALFMFLRSHRWIYTRPGCSHDVAYQDKLASGVLEHKTALILRSDGSEKTTTQVRITPKGMTHLARLFPSVVSEVFSRQERALCS